jgi:putative Mn2+ efflux pump MntP
MSFLTLLILSVGVASDNFAIALSKSAGAAKLRMRDILLASCTFGIFHAITPYIGWLIGIGVVSYISNWVDILACAVLVFLGGKMIVDIILEQLRERHDCDTHKDLDYCIFKTKEDGGDKTSSCGISLKEMLLIAFVTSIDALGVGFSLGIKDVNFLLIGSMFFLTVFLFAMAGFKLGDKIDPKYRNYSDVLGGIILIAVGIGMLL